MVSNVSVEQIKQDSFLIKKVLAEAGIEVNLAKARDITSALAGHLDWNVASGVATESTDAFSWKWTKGHGPRKGDAFLQIRKRGMKEPFATIVVRDAETWLNKLRLEHEKNAEHLCRALNAYHGIESQILKSEKKTDPSCGFYGGWGWWWEDSEAKEGFGWPMIATHDDDGAGDEYCVILGYNGEEVDSSNSEDVEARAQYIVSALELYDVARNQYLTQLCNCGKHFASGSRCECETTTLTLNGQPTYAAVEYWDQDQHGSHCKCGTCNSNGKAYGFAIKELGFLFENDDVLKSFLGDVVENGEILPDLIADATNDYDPIDVIYAPSEDAASKQAHDAAVSMGMTVVDFYSESSNFYMRLKHAAEKFGMI